MLGEFDVPVYGTPLTIGFVRSRLREHELPATLAVYEREPVRVGPFAIEPFAVTHSILDSVGLAIRTPVGTVVHTGDFKVDQTPLDGRLPDLGRLAELGAEGVLLLLSDSTNVEHAGVTPSERSVGRAPRADLPRGDGARRRHHLLVAHPSHAAGDRPRRCASAARSALVGRSLTSHVATARDLGLLHVADGTLVDLARAARPAAAAR